jgi:hypothetical protein
MMEHHRAGGDAAQHVKTGQSLGARFHPIGPIAMKADGHLNTSE